MTGTTRAMEVDLADPANNHDETTAAEVVGLLAGVAVLLMQAAAMVPGLLPVLLLLPIVLPAAALGLVAGRPQRGRDRHGGS